MQAICYRNTKTTIPGWVDNIHKEQPRGYAYETDTHFVHFYGRDNGFYVISPGLTVLEKKHGSLEDWVKRVFGANHITPMIMDVGHTKDGVWRPGLYFQEELIQGLDITRIQQRSAEQALRVLVEKLDEILLYIEPDKTGLDSYSHKTRELLILSCTELENQWKSFISKAGVGPINGRMFTTQDYVKLLKPLCLKEFQVKLRIYDSVPILQPFIDWDIASPTQSLSWYDAYNKTKHDRDKHFNSSKLINVMLSVAANLVLFCVRFGPFHLLNETKTLSTIVNQTFEIEMVNSDVNTFYIPLVSLPNNTREDLLCYDSFREGHIQRWKVDPLVI